MLLDLKKYLARVKAASMQDIATYFTAEPAVLRDMLALLMQKRQVKQAERVAGCGSRCARCNPLLTEIYQWVDK